LVKHVRQKHPEEEYVCKVRGCNAGMFFNRSQLDVHCRFSHANEEEEAKIHNEKITSQPGAVKKSKNSR